VTRFLIQPSTSSIDALVSVPGSKSVANRALICALLADGDSTVSGLPDGDDTEVIVEVLSQAKQCMRITSDSVVIKGSPVVRLPGIIDAQLAGTSSRFLTAVAALSDGTCIIDGGEPLRMRPMSDLHDALSALGATVTPLGLNGFLPVSVTRNSLHGGTVAVKGDVSSQFLSALMLIAPLLEGGLTIDVTGNLVSRSYVEMTARVMGDFGIGVQIEESLVRIAEGKYEPQNYIVEPDYSSAAFPLCAVAIAGGRVRIAHLATASLQGDSAIVEILTRMGVEISQDGDDIIAHRDPGRALQPIEINMANCSDLVPAVAVVCACAEGASVLSGIGFIRLKESDRLGDLATELGKSGVDVVVESDGLRVTGGCSLRSADFDTHHDHRLAMALSLLALVTGQVTVENPEVVSKSWPHYFENMLPILGVPSAVH
jgi:3-phosphoshikimate 1-carboxyvinyltransferase